MNKTKAVKKLNSMMLSEMPQYVSQTQMFDDSFTSLRRLLRSLMILRPPMKASREFLNLQDKLLKAEVLEKGIVDTENFSDKIVL